MAKGISDPMTNILSQFKKGLLTTQLNQRTPPPNINYQPNVSLDAQVANANTAFNAPINRALPAIAPIPMKYNYKPTL